MAKQKSVMGDIDWEQPLEIGPSTSFQATEPSQLPYKGSRAGFENTAGELLKAGASDLLQFSLLPFRIPGTELEKIGTPVSEAIPRALGVAELGRIEDPFQRLAGGGLRALPQIVLPGPKGSSLFARNPKNAAEAAATTFATGAGFEAGLMMGQDSAFETPIAIGSALSAGTASTILFNTLAKAPAILKPTINEIKKNFQEDEFNKLVSARNSQDLERILKENPDLLDRLSKVKEIQQLVPGFNPNLYQATGAETVKIRAEAALARQVDKIPEVKKQTEASIAAVRQKAAELFPLSSSSFAFAGRKLDKTETALASLVKAADDKIEESSRTMVKLGRQDIGQQIRKVYENRRESVRQMFNTQYDALDQTAFASGAKIAPEQTQAIFEIAQANREIFENTPELAGLISSVLKPTVREEGGAILSAAGRPMTPATTVQEFQPVKFSDLRSLSRRVNQDFYAAQQAATNNVPGAARNAFVLNQLKTKVDEAIETLPADIKDKFKALNSAYDSQYREVFRKGLGGMIGAETKTGVRIKDEDIIAKLTKESNVDDFYRVFGQSAETEEFLKNGLIEKFLSQSNSITAAGTVNDAALKTFMRQNEGVINKIPSLRAFLSKTDENLTTYMDQKNAAVAGMQALEKSSLAAIAKKDNIDAVFTTGQTGAFSNLNQLSQVIAASKADPTGRALNGVKGLMLDKALDAKDPVEFLTKNETAFKRAFGGDFGKVKQLTEAMQIMARNFDINPPIQLLEGDVARKAFGSGLPQVFSLLRDRITSWNVKMSILLSRFTQQKGIVAKDNAFIEMFKDTDAVSEALKNVKIINSKAASDAVKQKALGALSQVMLKYGVNLYRTGVTAGTGMVGEQRLEQAQQRRLNTPIELPEDALQ
jgi:hypothetical protein